MNSMKKSELVKVAKRIRRRLLALPSTKKNKNLEGFCAIYTALFLKEIGKTDGAGWAFNDEHCFPIVKGVVYDGTAKQFGAQYPTVFTGTFKEIYAKCHPNDTYYWGRTKRGKTAKQLLSAQDDCGWPPSQMVTNDFEIRQSTRNHGPFQ